MSKYGFGKAVDYGYDAAIAKVTEALGKEGFGVLTEIDVAATMKKKIGVDMPAYRILGACNPALANRAIGAEASIGLLLPCNVVVRDDAAGKTHVEFMDPIAILQMVDKPEIAELANEVRSRLDRVLAAL
ncbi:MAG: DUF302 domain-containing protein [Denitratisoma sp.]|nr:DUF302 domain-containing protein [Denitratisoma sp.]